MGDAFATMADNAPADPVAAADAALAPDEPTLASEPFVSPQGQAAAPLPDVSGIVAQQPRVPVPVMPPMPGSPLEHDPRARLALIAAIGAALAGGGSAGAGILHGTLSAIDAKHQEDVKRWQFQAQETKQQQLAAQNQQAIQDRQHEARLQQTFASLRDAVNKAPDEETYQKIIGGYSAQLQMAGYRIQPQALMAQFRFIPLTDEQQMKEKLGEYFASPYVKSLMGANPAAANAGAITIKRSGQEVRIPVTEALGRLGLDVPTTSPDGTPLWNAMGKGTDAAQALARAGVEFQTQFGRPPKPSDAKDNDWITQRAHQFTDKKDPVDEAAAAELNKVKLGNARLEGQKLQQDLANGKIIKVTHKDQVTGKSVIDYIPQSQLAGRTFDSPTNATTENRLASAQAVNQTGNDIITKLSDPAYASKLGVVMGRAGNLRKFIGNPPPEFSELAGMIESYSLANMGVHGMRSSQGAEQIKKLLDQPQTPASIIAAIKGLNAFSNHFMQNEGMTTPDDAAKASAAKKLSGR